MNSIPVLDVFKDYQIFYLRCKDSFVKYAYMKKKYSVSAYKELTSDEIGLHFKMLILEKLSLFPETRTQFTTTDSTELDKMIAKYFYIRDFDEFQKLVFDTLEIQTKSKSYYCFSKITKNWVVELKKYSLYGIALYFQDTSKIRYSCNSMDIEKPKQRPMAFSLKREDKEKDQISSLANLQMLFENYKKKSQMLPKQDIDCSQGIRNIPYQKFDWKCLDPIEVVSFDDLTQYQFIVIEFRSESYIGQEHLRTDHTTKGKNETYGFHFLNPEYVKQAMMDNLIPSKIQLLKSESLLDMEFQKYFTDESLNLVVEWFEKLTETKSILTMLSWYTEIRKSSHSMSYCLVLYVA